MDNLGLYIHIPFCKRKCLYCDFPSFHGAEADIGTYIDCLKSEIEMISQSCRDYKISTIFIGGGTPSYIPNEYIVSVLEQCRNVLHIDENAEVTMESNPGTLDSTSLYNYRNAGINRLSIGLQAVQDRILKTLGRIHDYNQFIEGYNEARKAGFENINIDLMFGLPGQTITDWKETLKSVCSLKPEHISCYSLIIEENTPFYDFYNTGSRVTTDLGKIPSEDEEREMYHLAIEYLSCRGYKHYEISNFAREGYECRHNLVYWTHQPYIGIGLAAHSFFENMRFHNTSRLEEYKTEIESGNLPRLAQEIIDHKTDMAEYMILGLRLIDGIDKNEFRKIFGRDIEEIFMEKIKKFEKYGLLINEENRIRLSKNGLDVANQVMSEFV